MMVMTVTMTTMTVSTLEFDYAFLTYEECMWVYITHIVYFSYYRENTFPLQMDPFASLSPKVGESPEQLLVGPEAHTILQTRST